MDTDCPKYAAGNVFDIKHVKLIKIKVFYKNGSLKEKKREHSLFQI